VRLDTGVNVLDRGVAHEWDRHGYRHADLLFLRSCEDHVMLQLGKRWQSLSH
jgi:hypothetical protein